MRKGRVYVYRRALALLITALILGGTVKGSDMVIDHVRSLSNPVFVCHVNSVIAETGDTLWDLVRKYCEGDIGYIVWLIIQSRGTAELHPGDVVTFPKYEG